jgi:hypothetical protein
VNSLATLLAFVFATLLAVIVEVSVAGRDGDEVRRRRSVPPRGSSRTLSWDHNAETLPCVGIGLSPWAQSHRDATA